MKLFNRSIKKIATDSRMISLALIAAAASPVVTAGEPGWYFGANIGEVEAKFDDTKISNQLLGTSFVGSNLRDDNKDNAYKLYFGYQFNPNFALEGGYFDFGKSHFTLDTLPMGTFSSTSKMKGFNFDARAILPVTDMFSLYALGGISFMDVRNERGGTGLADLLNSSRTDRTQDYKYGVGMELNFTNSFSMRVEAERYRVKNPVGRKDFVQLASLGFVYKFAN